MKLLDTSAWVEFFKGSPLGREVKGIIAGEQVYTSAITLAEITRWSLTIMVMSALPCSRYMRTPSSFQ